MAIRYICDWCDKPLPGKASGVDGKLNKITGELTYTREIDIREYFPHLCESCARKIDIVVGLARSRSVSKNEILERHRRLNEERRRKLGTKG